MLSCIALLLVAHLIGRYVRFVLGHDHVFGLIRLFNLNEEDNVPSLYSGLTSILSAALFLMIGITKRKESAPYAWHWIGLCFAFLFIASDELFYFHERIDTLLRHKFQLTGMFFYVWIIPYSAVALGIAIAYLRFFFALSTRFRILFSLAATLFLGGAVGIEAISGTIAEKDGVMNFAYIACATIEETCEMLGITVLVYGLFTYIETEWGGISFLLGDVHTS